MNYDETPESVRARLRELGVKHPSVRVALADQSPTYIQRQLDKIDRLLRDDTIEGILREKLEDVHAKWTDLWDNLPEDMKTHAGPPKFIQRHDLDALLLQHNVYRPDHHPTLTVEECIEGQRNIERFLKWVASEQRERRMPLGLSAGQTNLLQAWHRDWENLKRIVARSEG